MAFYYTVVTLNNRGISTKKVKQVLHSTDDGIRITNRLQALEVINEWNRLSVLSSFCIPDLLYCYTLNNEI